MVVLLTTALALPHSVGAQVVPAMEMEVSGADTSGINSTVTELTVTMVNNPNNPSDDVFETVAPPVTARFELF
ncbi:hypothetical protein, partial [Roseinatronobacter sp.]|uniref:hypothetical protein n=1 Tax=Roseinatronobacter sp. TaxID=1945755 RepID=UPI0025D17FDD